MRSAAVAVVAMLLAIPAAATAVAADGSSGGALPSAASAAIAAALARAGVSVREARLSGTDVGDHEQFGMSVAISGNTVVVGAPRHTVGGNLLEGAAYVFVKPAKGWSNMTEVAQLTASDGAPSDYFGQSVAISGNTIVVGAPYHTVVASTEQGMAYVFVKPTGGWTSATQMAELTINDGYGYDHLGASVAISGTTIVAGAPNHPIGGGTPRQGAAYVFVEPSDGWPAVVGNQTSELNASDAADNDGFGQSVAISGDTVVVGSPQHTVVASHRQGMAYVYVRPAAGWPAVVSSQTSELTMNDGVSGDLLGSSVAISGPTVVAGAPLHTVGANPEQGAAYVFVEPSGGWPAVVGNQTSELTIDNGQGLDEVGHSVALSGRTIVVGASGHAVNGNSAQGVAELFMRPRSGWPAVVDGQTVELLADQRNGAANDQFGAAVALMGDTVIAGAPSGKYSGLGSTYVDVLPPTDTVPPVISGTAKRGRTLKASKGSWFSLDALTFSYHWSRCSKAGSRCRSIAGATRPSYKLTRGDVGHRITVVVQAVDQQHQAASARARAVGPVR
jgi:hypothetical protein